MSISRLIAFTLFFLFLSFKSQAQNGVIANYKAEEMYLTFKDMRTGEVLDNTMIIGTNVRIKYNVSYESLTISYINRKDNLPKTMVYRFIRNEPGGSVIMDDGHGNPFTVVNKLQEKGELGIMAHDLMDEKYLSIISIIKAEQIY